MSRRCLICANINPCRQHSDADQDAELRRNTREVEGILAERAALASPSPDTPEKRMLLDLLAVIHRDGGQYTDEHGLAASVADAMLLSSERLPDTPEIEGRGQ